jgi:hypothetical protein
MRDRRDADPDCTQVGTRGEAGERDRDESDEDRSVATPPCAAREEVGSARAPM